MPNMVLCVKVSGLPNTLSAKNVPLTTEYVNSTNPANMPRNISFSRLSSGGRKFDKADARRLCKLRFSSSISTANSVTIPNSPYASSDETICSINGKSLI